MLAVVLRVPAALPVLLDPTDPVEPIQPQGISPEPPLAVRLFRADRARVRETRALEYTRSEAIWKPPSASIWSFPRQTKQHVHVPRVNCA